MASVIRRHALARVVRVASLMALDYIGVVSGLFSALALKAVVTGVGGIGFAWRQTAQVSTFAYLVTVLMFAKADLYANRSRRGGMGQIASSLAQVAVISLIFALANGRHSSSYYLFYASVVLCTAYVAGLRDLHLHATARVLARAGYRRRAILIGSGHHVDAVAAALANRSRTRTDIVGCIPAPAEETGDPRPLGLAEDFGEALVRQQVEEVIIADPILPQDTAVNLVDLCHRRGVTVHVAPTMMGILMERAEFEPGQSVPLFRVRQPVFDGLEFALKRSLDLLFSTVALMALSPLLLAIAVIVKLSSPGPVIYRSIRPGIAGRPFACLKFRTMHEGADRLQAELESLNEKSGALFKIALDPRVTRVGRWLRRLSLDELPQLVNVIRGEMSLVGPRPLPMRDYERLEEWHKKRYGVLPGITGLWQVSGRAELDFDDLVRLDFLYLERWTVLLDLWILLKTIPAVLGRRGAF